jgi:hypothetical protein
MGALVKPEASIVVLLVFARLANRSFVGYSILLTARSSMSVLIIGQLALPRSGVLKMGVGLEKSRRVDLIKSANVLGEDLTSCCRRLHFSPALYHQRDTPK